MCVDTANKLSDIITALSRQLLPLTKQAQTWYVQLKKQKLLSSVLVCALLLAAGSGLRLPSRLRTTSMRTCTTLALRAAQGWCVHASGILADRVLLPALETQTPSY
jgi:hypothetical protein